ncbi:MAG: hypothetical protein AAF789_04315 [Bacteroidota bacterium]
MYRFSLLLLFILLSYLVIGQGGSHDYPLPDSVLAKTFPKLEPAKVIPNTWKISCRHGIMIPTIGARVVPISGQHVTKRATVSRYISMSGGTMQDHQQVIWTKQLSKI